MNSTDWLQQIIGTAAFDDAMASLPPDPVHSPAAELYKIGRALEQRLVERRRRRRASNQNANLRSFAVETGLLAPRVEYWIVENGITGECRAMRAAETAGLLPAGFCDSHPTLFGMEGALNGYVAFDKRDAPVSGRTLRRSSDLLTYIPVHGGVTYANKDATACVFGFDTSHYNSEYVPRKDKQWIKWQCQVLYEGLLAVKKIEAQYWRLKGDNHRVAELIQPLLHLIPEEEINTGTIINLLSGEL